MPLRRRLSREVELEAVKLVTERGVAAAQAARDLDVGESVAARALAEAPVSAVPGHGPMRSGLAEIAALGKEVARLKAERAIPRKAAAFFARGSTCGSPSSRSTATSGRCRGSATRSGRVPLRLPCLAEQAGQRPCFGR